MMDTIKEAWEWICGLFNKEQQTSFFLIRETKHGENEIGIETYMNNDVLGFPDAYKSLVVAFLESATKSVKESMKDGKKG